MMDPRDRSRCYHCGASGVPLLEWQPDPPRPDVSGPFPMVCANGCGVPAMRIELAGGQTLSGFTPPPGGAWITIENLDDQPLTMVRERPPVIRVWDLDTEAGAFIAEAQIGDRAAWRQAPAWHLCGPSWRQFPPWAPQLELECAEWGELGPDAACDPRRPV